MIIRLEDCQVTDQKAILEGERITFEDMWNALFRTPGTRMWLQDYGPMPYPGPNMTRGYGWWMMLKIWKMIFQMGFEHHEHLMRQVGDEKIAKQIETISKSQTLSLKVLQELLYEGWRLEIWGPQRHHTMEPLQGQVFPPGVETFVCISAPHPVSGKSLESFTQMNLVEMWGMLAVQRKSPFDHMIKQLMEKMKREMSADKIDNVPGFEEPGEE